LVDARQRILGRMATGIATTLMGKHKPIYDPACNYMKKREKNFFSLHKIFFD